MQIEKTLDNSTTKKPTENKSSLLKETNNEDKDNENNTNKSKKEIDEAKLKNRKVVHDFLHFIEAVNNRFLISQFRASETQTKKKRHQNQTRKRSGSGKKLICVTKVTGCGISATKRRSFRRTNKRIQSRSSGNHEKA